MFNNSLFNSTGSGYGMPQYVQQPSAEGSQPDFIGRNIKLFSGKFMQPKYGPLKEFSPTMAIPEWAKAMPSAPAAQFSNPLFSSSSNPYIAAPQSVMQPSSAAPPAKFNGVK
jgi:hypothetical protein